MAQTPAIVQGRAAFARQEWTEAHALLSAADRESPLEPADLERLATAAYLVGEDARAVAHWVRAHHELIDLRHVERAARLGYQRIRPHAQACLTRIPVVNPDHSPTDPAWRIRAMRSVFLLRRVVALQPESEDTMSQHQAHGKRYEGTVAENYQRFFVPAIGAPVADDLIAVAGLQPGERVLDVACGTGVATRLAAQRVKAAGSVTGLDIHPGMLAVARAETPSGMSIHWREASAESMPFPDNAFDVVLCQMGLQFVPGKLAALREMRRVLEPGGRAVVSVPGPKPPLFAIMGDALARHVCPKAASFGDLVFSMHDVDELKELMRCAGFGNVDVESNPKTLRLPAPADFLWQYIHSTPLAEATAQAGEAKRDALERDVCAQWQEFVVDGFLPLRVGMTTATALK